MPAIPVAAVSDRGNVSFQVSTFPTSTPCLAGTGELSRIRAARTSALPHTGQLRSSRETSCGEHHFPMLRCSYLLPAFVPLGRAWPHVLSSDDLLV